MSEQSYAPPYILRLVGGFLTYLRREYSDDFARFVTAPSGSIEQASYRSGIIFNVCLVGSVLFIWCFILLWLKINSKYVGCAAGKPFRQQKKRQLPFSKQTKAKNGKRSQKGAARQQKRTLNTEEAQSKGALVPQSSADGRLGQAAHALENASSDRDDCLEIISFTSGFSIPSQTSHRSSGEAGLQASGRERRSQCCFCVFGFVAFLCLPLILALCVRPIVAATNGLYYGNEEANSLFILAGGAVDAIESTYTDTIANKTTSLSSDLREHCPNAAQVRSIYSIDFEAIFDVVAPEAAEVDGGTKQLLRNVDGTLLQYRTIVATANRYFATTRSLLWLPPVVLFALILAVVVMVIGVYFAWVRQSSSRFQNLLSYAILPFVIVLALACWALLIGSVVSTSVMSDICQSSNSEGAPDDTIKDILELTSFASGSPLYEYTTGMVSGCNASNPALELENLSKRAEFVVEILRSVSLLIESAGKGEIAAVCSENEGDNDFIDDLPGLIDHYTIIQTNLDNLADALACEVTHDLYAEAVQESICTEIASASSWAFVLFLVLGFSTMGMVSLRASWRHHAVEDRIYDESEAAENMILDEHEDYLVYISKFRHEWEEYHGLDPSLREDQIQLDSTESIQESASATTTEEGNKYLEVNPGALTPSQSLASEDQSQIQDVFDPYNTDSQSIAQSVDSISFLSLKDSKPSSPRQVTSSLPSLLITNQSSNGSCLDDEADLLHTPSVVDSTPTGD